jgi:hypothetical protein
LCSTTSFFSVFLKTFTSAIVFLGLFLQLVSKFHSGIVGSVLLMCCTFQVWFASGLRKVLALDWWFQIHRILVYSVFGNQLLGYYTHFSFCATTSSFTCVVLLFSSPLHLE